jgi:hypothetical protein
VLVLESIKYYPENLTSKQYLLVGIELHYLKFNSSGKE